MRALATLALAALLAACSTPAPPPAPTPPPAPPAPAAPPPAPPPVAKAEPVVPVESPMERFERERRSADERSVYFAFDRYTLNPDDDAVIAAHARLAQSYANDHLTLRGNCDERGSREYNLALGQHRADTVKQRLVLLGVAADRIETVSLGKEQPRALCHEEKCWSQNRRTDFVDTWK
jgi:peptidoglycan-associated lipoprotein